MMAGVVAKMTELQSSEILSEQGPLANLLPGFKVRVQQQQMAAHVAKALEDNSALVCEAGTGTGKTFAYLVPALMCGKKTIISTGTKALQDQLYHRDLPLVREALALPISTALLKGRANYLCLQRLEQHSLQGGGLSSKMQAELVKVKEWRHRTQSGDVAELSTVAEDSPVWPLVTSTTDNCLGQGCPMFDDCHVLKARREAMRADVVVVNHHLFLADMALREEGFGEVLPGAEAVIFDEAHQLYDIASRFFSVSVSRRQLLGLAEDSIAAERDEAGDSPDLTQAAGNVQRTLRDCRLALGGQRERGTWSDIAARPSVSDAFGAVYEHLDTLRRELERTAERGKQLTNCLARCEDMIRRLQRFLREESAEQRADPNWVNWFEVSPRSFALHSTPLAIDSQFDAYRARYRCAWVFTSATLAVGEDFSHFTRRLGLEGAETLLLGSPFDFPRQALLYLPRTSTDPGTSDHVKAVVDLTLPVLQASQGRAFLLFTSYRALHKAAELLNTRTDYPLLLQGEAPKAELLRRFCRTPGAVLLGTSSFWQGVDVRGDALSCVVIDKLPFAPPDDPILRARIKDLREQGLNPFLDHQLPEAVIALKQGAGRLIRDTEDRGVMVICDPRLTGKGYGRVFLDALPDMPVTRDLEAVIEFYGNKTSR